MFSWKTSSGWKIWKTVRITQFLILIMAKKLKCQHSGEYYELKATVMDRLTQNTVYLSEFHDAHNLLMIDLSKNYWIRTWKWKCSNSNLLSHKKPQTHELMLYKAVDFRHIHTKLCSASVSVCFERSKGENKTQTLHLHCGPVSPPHRNSGNREWTTTSVMLI